MTVGAAKFGLMAAAGDSVVADVVAYGGMINPVSYTHLTLPTIYSV